MLTYTSVTLGAAAVLPASLPSPSNSVWYIGPFPLRAYALCILTGVFIAVWWAGRRYAARGGDKEVILDIALVAVPAGIIGARIYHVLSSPDAYFGPHGDLSLIPQVWQGGLGIWGGIAAGVAAAAWYVRRRGLRLAPIADAAAPTLLVAQAIGRFGNWFNQELFGAPTTLPWGLEIDAAHIPPEFPPGTLFHPTFLYEALWNLAGAALLVWLGRYLRTRDGFTGGRLMWAYLMVYTAGRTWIEMLRIDQAHTVAGLRLNVWTSLLVFALGAVAFWRYSRRSLSDALTRDEPPDGRDSQDIPDSQDSAELTIGDDAEAAKRN